MNWKSPLTLFFAACTNTPVTYNVYIYNIYSASYYIYTPNAGTRAPTFCNLLLHVDTAATHHPIPAAALNIISCPPECATRSHYHYYYTTRTHTPGTMNVICTRKQKPGEISPGRVYISPENDNTAVHYVITTRCIIMSYGRGPLADDPPPPLITPRPVFRRIRCTVGENVLTVYGISTRRRQNVYII